MDRDNRTLWLALALVGSMLALCLCVAVGLGGAALFYVARAEKGGAPAPIAAGAAVEVLGTDLSGRTWTMADLSGRPYVINFWASWCGPCQDELPVMQELANEFAAQGVVVLLVNDQETVNQARDYLKYHDLALPCIPDPSGELARRYRVRGLPTTLMYDASGELKARLTGFGGPEQLRRAFEKIID